MDTLDTTPQMETETGDEASEIVSEMVANPRRTRI